MEIRRLKFSWATPSTFYCMKNNWNRSLSRKCYPFPYIWTKRQNRRMKTFQIFNTNGGLDISPTNFSSYRWVVCFNFQFQPSRTPTLDHHSCNQSSDLRSNVFDGHCLAHEISCQPLIGSDFCQLMTWAFIFTRALWLATNILCRFVPRGRVLPCTFRNKIARLWSCLSADFDSVLIMKQLFPIHSRHSFA